MVVGAAMVRSPGSWKVGQVCTGREPGESAQSAVSVGPSLVTARPGAVRGANPGHLALLLVPLTETQENQSHLDTWAPVTSSGLSRLPKSQRRVLQGALISLTLWSAPAFACERLQDLVDMQISVLLSEEEQTGGRQI